MTQRSQAEQVRVRILNESLRDRVPHMGAQEIIGVANLLMDLWIQADMPSLAVPSAYASLKFLSVRHPSFLDLLSASLEVVLLDSHPVFLTYAFVPQEERQIALERLRVAVERIGNDVPEQDTNDWRLPLILQRLEQELLRPPPTAPVERDPEGGINLQAFATDAENVHRSSVQNTTREQIQHILTIPCPEEQNTLLEIHRTYRNEQTLAEVRQNCLHITCFDVGYQQLLNHVWAYIQSHTEKEELERRLEEEILDGIGTCPNGKMCRLVNSLQGYLELPTVPSREVFQARMATLQGQPNAQEQAQGLFEEFAIPEGERAQWLEPFLANTT
jgi:hypothetical protein